MITYIRSRLGLKLFLSYLIIILVGVLVISVTSEALAPRAFNRHLLGMMQGKMSMGNGSLMGSGGFGQGLGLGMVRMSDLYGGFRAGLTEALTLSVIVAVAVAVVISLVISRGVVAPVRATMQASQRIAAGHYDERLESRGPDELGQLAYSFNQMAERLEQVESLRRQLIGDVSHELRTPLTALKGSMEGLIDGLLPATPETFQELCKEADRLSHLVDDLQELSRVEAGAYQLERCALAVSDLVKTTVTRLKRQFESKGVKLRMDIPADLPHVLADEDRIGQVLINLVGNALQYTSRGGRVAITAQRHGDEVQISVIDTGVGLEAEQLPHIFDRFYRVDKSRSRRAGGGSGIGLTVARHLVEAHDGRIWAESPGRGKGSTFAFTLPIAK
jgi:two-component system sensor histidine kinase BaeS